MAFKKGTSNGELIEGTDGQDTILGMGGKDFLVGYGGIDSIYGGDDGDQIFGGDGGDHLFGEAGNDYIYGDYAPNEYGNDQISGGDGNDFIFGGAGADLLSGGNQADVFYFEALDSDPMDPDDIWDFQAFGPVAPRGLGAYDKIAVDGPGGTLSNYFELSIGYEQGYYAARSAAVDQMWGTTDPIRYVFVTDGVDGYLFADANNDGLIENGIVLVGLNSLWDFSHKNIINIADSPL
jgi:hypothetical protein